MLHPWRSLNISGSQDFDPLRDRSKAGKDMPTQFPRCRMAREPMRK